MGVAGTVGGESESTGLWALVLQFNKQVLRREEGCRLVGPFDDTDSIAIGVLVEAKVLSLTEVIDSVEVDVVEGQSALVFRDQDEGGAADISIDAEATGDPLGEAGLAGAQLSNEEEKIAGARRLAQEAAQALGLLGRAGLHGKGGAL